MTQKKAKKYEQPGMPIAKLDHVPGPEASAAELTKHFQRVQIILACHRYDDVLAACHWCCDMEAGLAYSKPDEARGNRMFCSGRCASAHAAYRVIAHGSPKPKADTDTNTDNEKGKIKGTAINTKTDPDPEPEQETEPDHDDDNPPDEAQESNTEEPNETAAPSESPSDWKPKGQRARKPRKARAAKPERTDGKCAKGIHQMDEANRYEYKGTVWCRECRKASRSKSKNGNGKSK